MPSQLPSHLTAGGVGSRCLGGLLAGGAWGGVVARYMDYLYGVQASCCRQVVGEPKDASGRVAAKDKDKGKKKDKDKGDRPTPGAVDHSTMQVPPPFPLVTAPSPCRPPPPPPSAVTTPSWGSVGRGCQ